MHFTSIVLPLSLLTVAMANDVRFYSARGCSASSFAGCANIAQRTCCVTNTGGVSVSISKNNANDVAQGFSGGGCSTQSCSAGGTGTYCCVSTGSGRWTGGAFFRRAKRAEEEMSACTSTMEANIFGFDSGDSSYEIHADNVKGSFAKMQQEFEAVPMDKKVSWLKSHGAVKKASAAAKDAKSSNVDLA